MSQNALLDVKERRRLRRDYARFAGRFPDDHPLQCRWAYWRSIQYRTLIYYRLSRLIGIPGVRHVFSWLYRRAALRSGVEISCPVGGGMIIPHWGSIKLNARHIGRDLYVLQNVTIGDDYRTGRPVIGNNVFIGTGSTVVGNITIGDNVVIGAMSFIHEDVLPNTMIAGNPARVIRAVTAADIQTMTTYG
ncbi:MAG: serine acetyltransferase [Verrucomicrobia bacterium]|nr:serine acetyltransferase [Verrucomicrobiota bacterium]